MPKWKRQNETVCMHGTVKCANAEDDAEAQYIVTMHNADIDALTAEVDELQRRCEQAESDKKQLGERWQELREQLDAIIVIAEGREG